MKLRRTLLRAAVAAAILTTSLLVFAKLRYGGGAPYPDTSTVPRVASGDVRPLVELAYPPGNVTASPDGRIFFNLHPFVQAHRFTDAYVFELVDGAPRPYPDLTSQADLQNVFGMTVDAKGRLWMTSPATLDRAQTRLVAYDLATNAKVIDRTLPPGVARFGQDLRVSNDGRYVFLADTGAFRFTHAALVVLDLADGTTREVLGASARTQPQGWTIATRGGPYRIGYGLLSFVVGVDGIALDRDGAWLYFAAMSHDTLFRVRTADLVDRALTEEALDARVEAVGTKPLSDGIEVTPDGAVLVTDVEHGGIARIDRDGRRETLVRMDGVVWADGVTVTPGGDVLFTDSAIPAYIDPLLRAPSPAKIGAGRPYSIWRFRP